MIQKWEKWFRNLPLVVTLQSWLKRIILPGFNGIPLWDVLAFLFKGLKHFHLTTKASSLAYKFFLAIFPALIFLINLLPYIPIPHFQDELLDMLKGILPGSVYEIIQETIEDLIKNQRGGLLSFGFLFAMYLTTDGVVAMINAFNSINRSYEHRTFLQIYGISALLVLIMTLLLTVAVSLIFFSEAALKYLENKSLLTDKILIFALIAGKWLVVLFLFMSAISLLYYFGPDKRTKFYFVTPGSLFATLFTILVSLGFSYYVNNFATYNKLYGSIGTVMVLMLFFYFNSLVILLGFELNASIKDLRRKKNLEIVTPEEEPHHPVIES